MSNDEKDKQIGQVIQEYSEAKKTLAHLQMKISNVATAYKEIHSRIDRSDSLDHIEISGRKIVLKYTNPGFDSSAILSGEELASLLSERNEAKNRVEQLRKQLVALGISDVQ